MDCDAPTIYEEELHDAVVTALRQIFGTQEAVCDCIRNDILEALDSDHSDEIKQVDRKQQELRA